MFVTLKKSREKLTLLIKKRNTFTYSVILFKVLLQDQKFFKQTL